MATTLIQAGEATEQAYEDLRDEAQDALSKSAEDLRTAQDEHSDLLEDRAGLEKDVADIRTAMLDALMPADVEALADDLRLKQIALRKLRAELLSVKEKVSSLAAALAGAQEQFKEAPRSLAVAQRELADARKRDALHSDWRGAVSAGTLTDLAAEAQAMLDAAAGGPVVVGEDEDVTLLRAAKARTDDVDADIPAALRTRARERAAAVEASMSADAGLLSSVEDSLYQHRQATEGVAGASSRLWYAFEQAEHAFGDLVTHAQTRYDEAVSLLSSIEGSAELTAAESARIDAVALTGGDEEALTKEKAVADAKLAVQAKEVEIELAIAQVLIADIDADAEADSTVSDLRAELAPLQVALETAEGELTQEMIDNLDLWEASVPDHVWANLAAYDRAIALLTEIAGGDASALETAMDNAEAALAQALEDEDKATRVRGYLEAEVALWRNSVEHARNSKHERVLSAMRGDK